MSSVSSVVERYLGNVFYGFSAAATSVSSCSMIDFVRMISRSSPSVGMTRDRKY